MPVAPKSVRRLQFQDLEERRVLAALPGLESFDFEGQDVKVGIISDSFNSRGGLRNAVRAGELPGRGNPLGFDRPIEILVDADSRLQDRGKGIAELIHDVAPAATLVFHATPESYYDMSDAMNALANAGVDVIVTDASFFQGEGYLQTFVEREIEELVESGVVVIAAAGDLGDSGYESSFVGVDADDRPADAPEFLDDFFGYEVDLHDFDPGPGIDVTQSFVLPAGEEISLILTWNEDPRNLPTGSPSDEFLQAEYAMFLTDDAGNDVLPEFVFPTTRPRFAGYFQSRLSYVNETAFPQRLNLSVAEVQNAFLRDPKISILTTKGSFPVTTEYPTNSSSQYGVASVESVITVGASLANRQVRSYSSTGGREIAWYFDNRNANNGDFGDVEFVNEIFEKPDFVAPDADALFTFNQEWNETTFPNAGRFYSTTASAAKTAGLVALMLEASDKTLSPDQVRDILRESAIDIETPGFDFSSGHGVINAPAAIEAATPFQFVFTAALPDGQRELFISDGTRVGTRLLRDLSGGVSANPRWLTPLGDRLYFSARLPNGQRELFRTDGTAESTMLVTNLAGSSGSNPRDLTVVGDTLFFLITDANGDDRVYRSNGTRRGTVPVTNPSNGIREPGELTAVGDQLFFYGREDGPAGRRVYSFGENGAMTDSFRIQGPVEALIPFGDSVAALINFSGGRRIRVLVDGPSGPRFARESSESFQVVGEVVGDRDSIFFTVDDGRRQSIQRGELSADGRSLRLNPVAQSPVLRGVPHSPTTLDGQLFFTANIPPANRELFVGYGINDSARLVRDLFAAHSSEPEQLTAAGELMYFTATQPNGEVELFASDGSRGGTYRVENLSGRSSSQPENLTAIGGMLVFSAMQSNGQREPFVSDGTERGTRRIANLSGSRSSSPRSFTDTSFDLTLVGRDLVGRDMATQVAASSTDVNRDGRTSAIDALMVINSLASQATDADSADVNGDGALTALDALVVINEMTRSRQSQVSFNHEDDDADATQDDSESLSSLLDNDIALAQLFYGENRSWP